MEWMVAHDRDLRNAYEKRFPDIVRATEEYAMAKDWSKEFRSHSVSGFFQLLRDCGVLKGVNRARVFTVVLSHLYFYVGLLTLDRAASIKRP
jgi:mRNA-degrading endonuclease YafQ of YafQ-DinJ toxin-antitoxin module